MADDFKNIVVQGPEDRPRRPPYLLLILLIVCVVAAIVLNRSGRHDQQRAAQAPPPPPPKQPVLNLERQAFQAMRVLYGNKSLAEARAKGYDLLGKTKDPALQYSTEELLGQINTELIFTPVAMPEKEEYLVQPGDNLERIAKKFKTTVELIKKSNALDERAMLHPGDRLQVFNGAFSLAISKGRNDLVLSVNDRFFKRYRIGTGKFGSTPTGTFVIGEKIKEPAWWRPDGQMIPYGDKENILGTHWMTLTATGSTPAVRGYGLHGTWEEETIGQQASAGCVRLLNSEVEELFTLLPMGTPVVIAE